MRRGRVIARHCALAMASEASERLEGVVGREPPPLTVPLPVLPLARAVGRQPFDADVFCL